jgi:hypothetical protein
VHPGRPFRPLQVFRGRKTFEETGLKTQIAGGNEILAGVFPVPGAIFIAAALVGGAGLLLALLFLCFGSLLIVLLHVIFFALVDLGEIFGGAGFEEAAGIAELLGLGEIGAGVNPIALLVFLAAAIVDDLGVALGDFLGLLNESQLRLRSNAGGVVGAIVGENGLVVAFGFDHAAGLAGLFTAFKFGAGGFALRGGGIGLGQGVDQVGTIGVAQRFGIDLLERGHRVFEFAVVVL